MNKEDRQVGDWVRKKGHTLWEQIRDVALYPTPIIAEIRRITPISYLQFNNIQIGSRVLIAPEWYIREQCSSSGKYGYVDYVDWNGATNELIETKKTLYGKVVQVSDIMTNMQGPQIVVCIPNTKYKVQIHIAFILDVDTEKDDTGVRAGELVCDEGKWYRIKVVHSDRSEVIRLCDGLETGLLSVTLSWIPRVRTVDDLNPDWYVKVKALGKWMWCQVKSLDLTALKMENIADISTDKKKPHSIPTISAGDWVQWKGGPEWTQIDQIFTGITGNLMYRERHPRGSKKFVDDITVHSVVNPNKTPAFDIEVGDWVKHSDFDGWQQVVAYTSGISVNDRKGSGDHGFYSKDRVIDHKKTITLSDQKWDKLKAGHWVKIATEDYIKNFLGHDGKYCDIDYTASDRKRATFGTWQKVIRKHQSKPSVGVCDTFSIHRDFIVGTSEEQPKLTLKEYAHKLSLEGYDYDGTLEEYKKGSMGCSMTVMYDANSGEKIIEGSWVMLRDFFGYHRVHKITENPTQLNVGALNMWVKPNAITASIIAIPDQEWDKLKPGMWVKIAPREYIKSVCQIDSYGKWMHKNNNYALPDKMKMFGKWHQVMGINSRPQAKEVLCGGFYWHKDIIVDISETEPVVSQHTFTAPTSGTYVITVGDKETARIPLPEGLQVDEKSVVTEEQLYAVFSGFKTKEQEKIMLNTVEEIGKLDKPNLEEAAKQVKASRDNDEVAAAKTKLTQLLNQESGLKARKKEIDEDLANVQELIKAFGYPPKDAK